MAKVNLLPWRSERRKVRQKEFGFLLGGTAIAAVVLGLFIWFFYKGQIEGQNARNAYLNNQITLLDAQIKEIDELDAKRDTLLRRKDVIENLQANRSQMVHLFDELVRTIPDGVRLTSVKQEGNKLTLEGQSQSNARVSAYMRNIEASGWMTNPDLSVIEVRDDDKTLPYQFNLSLTLRKPGQLVDKDGNPVLGDDGKPVMAPAQDASQPTAVPADAAPAVAPAPATTAPTPADASKGGATP